MEQNSHSTSRITMSRLVGALALTSLLTAVPACSPPTPSQFETEFFQRFDYREGLPSGQPNLRAEGFVCDEKVWRGPKTSATILARPVLGLYADGRKGTSPDVDHLASDDLALEIDQGLGVVTDPLSSETTSVSKNVNWLNGQWLGHSSRRYISPGVREPEDIKARAILRQVVRVMGVPRFAEIPHCGPVIALYYGNPSILLSDPSNSRLATVPRDNCRFGTNFLIVQISRGSFSVTSPSRCEK
jgi:hypothetical protein